MVMLVILFSYYMQLLMPLYILLDNLCRNTAYNGMSWHIFCNNSACSDNGALANMNTLQYLCALSYPYMVFDNNRFRNSITFLLYRMSVV